MKIIETRAAPNPRRVRIFLAEKGIEVEFQELDLMKGELKTAEFSAMNPLQRVPILVLDDGTVLSETVAISRYFEELQPEPALFGRGALGRAVVEMWQRRVEFNVYAPTREVFRHAVPFAKALEPVQLADWADLNRPRVAKGLQLLDDQLRDRPFIAGDRFTIADITAVFAMQMIARLGLPLPDKAAALARWREAVFARPSVISVIGPPKD